MNPLRQLETVTLDFGIAEGEENRLPVFLSSGFRVSKSKDRKVLLKEYEKLIMEGN